MDVTDEKLILSNLIIDNEYIGQVLPFLQAEYFQNKIERASFEVIRDYIQTYNTLPNRTTIVHDLREKESLNENETVDAEQLIKEICNIERPPDRVWLIKKTEEFCQNKAVYNAILKAISVYDGTEKTITAHSIPDLVRDAISINFDSHIGMDLYNDANARYDYYTLQENKIPFSLAILNEITNGGLGRKSLNLILAGLNVGKSLSLVSLSCDYAKLGFNVLYITMEMREEEILKRIDANLLKVSMNKLNEFSRENFINKIEKLDRKVMVKLK
jgi:replicative DNA helicase